MIKDAEITIAEDTVEIIEHALKDAHDDYVDFLENQDRKKILAFLNVLEEVSATTPIVGEKHKSIVRSLGNNLSTLISNFRDRMLNL